jgi:acyl-CoA-binding protein
MMGNNTTPKPAFYDMTGGAKWAAWGANKDISQDEAKKRYISYVGELFAVRK